MSSLGAVFKDEGDGYVDLVAPDVAVIDEDVHVLHPTTLYASQRLVGPIYAFLYSFLETIRMDDAQLGYACNSHMLYGYLPSESQLACSFVTCPTQRPGKAKPEVTRVLFTQARRRSI